MVLALDKFLYRVLGSSDGNDDLQLMVKRLIPSQVEEHIQKMFYRREEARDGENRREYARFLRRLSRDEVLSRLDPWELAVALQTEIKTRALLEPVKWRCR